jgi:hypothetical protein
MTTSARGSYVLIVVALLVCGTAQWAMAEWVPLYDVDFSTPPHVVGEPPVLGDGPCPRHTPSEIWFGEPLVVEALGALTDQPCAFGNHPEVAFDQLNFVVLPEPAEHGVPGTYDAFHISVDLLIDVAAPQDLLKIILDCPSAHQMQFRPPDEIWVDVGGDGGYEQQIGSFQEGVPIHLDIVVNTQLNYWGVLLDGNPEFTGDFPSEQLARLRFSLSSTEAEDPVAIDNVFIEGFDIPDCPEDLNGDGVVDVEDLLILLGNFGGSGDGDINDDGVVDVQDLLALLGAWGVCA